MPFSSASGLPRFVRIATFFGTIIAFSVICLAGKSFVKPVAQPAKTYPAHDEHPTEHVTVAADPYDMADKAAIFSVKYQDHSYLPIFVIVTNDGNQPISLTDMTAQLVTVNRTKLSPATVDDLYRRLSRPARSDVPSPLPFPRKKVKGAVSPQALEEISSAQFTAKAVEPHGTQSGFLFFDIEGISTPLAGARFYLNRVKDVNGNELIYFEIPMEKYLTAPSSKTASSNP